MTISATMTTPQTQPDAPVGAAWDRVPGFLNAATMGLPPRAVTEAMTDAIAEWATGKACPTAYDDLLNEARADYARLVNVPADHVAVASQVSVLVGPIAASLPDGADVLVIEGDFTSIVFPFLVQAHRGVTVRQVPREELAAHITDDTDLVVFSLAQSACGRLVDVEAVTSAARAHGALTLCDTTQAAGWMPVDASIYDMTVCGAYKWLCQPRGTAYLTISPELVPTVTPVNAGWYAGKSIWESVYGPQMDLADDASRFDVSPAWLCWVGAAAAMKVFLELDMEQVRAHGAGLADDLRTRLGEEPCGRPVVTLDDADGSRAAALAERGIVVASRGGGVRIAFHVWNTSADVDLVHAALTGR